MNSTASHRPYSWAKYWSRMGYSVTVLTVTKEIKGNDLNYNCSNFEVIEVENKFRNKLKKILGYKNESMDNNNNSKISLKSKILNKLKNFFNSRGIVTWDARYPNLCDFWIKGAFNIIKKRKFDLVISTFAPYATHLVALKYKKCNPDVFWVADYRDLWSQNHMFKGLFPFTLIEKYLEKKVNQSADLIITVSEPLAYKIASKYKLSHVEVVENGFDLEDLENIPKEKFWNDNKIRLVYTGSIYKETRDPSPLFEAINMINSSTYRNLLDKLEVIFAGFKANLDELVAKYSVSSWVKYVGFLPREDILRMQRDAHALIFLECEKVDGILTGKLFEYLFSGTQILGIGITDKSAPGKLIKESGLGINFGKDAEKIRDYLIDLLRKETKPVFEKNISFLEKYTREYQAKRLLELVERYMNRRY